MIDNMSDSNISVNHNVSDVLYCIYLMHYAVNFAIYAARSEQYRQAYIYFINEVCSCSDSGITY